MCNRLSWQSWSSRCQQTHPSSSSHRQLRPFSFWPSARSWQRLRAPFGPNMSHGLHVSLVHISTIYMCNNLQNLVSSQDCVGCGPTFTLSKTMNCRMETTLKHSLEHKEWLCIVCCSVEIRFHEMWSYKWSCAQLTCVACTLGNIMEGKLPLKQWPPARLQCSSSGKDDWKNAKVTTVGKTFFEILCRENGPGKTGVLYNREEETGRETQGRLGTNEANWEVEMTRDEE